MDERVAKLEKETARQKTRLDAQNLLKQWELRFQHHSIGAEQAALRVGSAYRRAFDAHKKALEDQAKLNQLVLDLVFGVMGVATAGALSWMSGPAKAMKTFEHWSDRQRDAAWASFSAGVGPVRKHVLEDPAKEAAKSPLAPVSLHPHEYQNQLVDRVLTVRRDTVANFQQVHEAMGQMTPEAWDSYSSARTVFRLSLHWAGASLTPIVDNLKSEQEIERELERGMWRAWSPKMTSVTYDVVGGMPVGGSRVVYSLGSHIEKRFDLLGISRGSNKATYDYLRGYVLAPLTRSD